VPQHEPLVAGVGAVAGEVLCLVVLCAAAAYLSRLAGAEEAETLPAAGEPEVATR
jgi:hypothetical protein